MNRRSDIYEKYILQLTKYDFMCFKLVVYLCIDYLERESRYNIKIGKKKKGNSYRKNEEIS